MGDNDECGDEFVGYNEWATGTLGVSLFTDFVYDYDEGERGVFVAEDIAPQTCVVSVPFASLLTLEWIREQADRGHPVYSSVSAFRKLLEAPRSQWDPEAEDDVLALALLYERYVAKDRSFWRPHLELLPKRYDNLLYFSEKETKNLKGSNVFFLARQMRLKVDEDYARLRASVIPEFVGVVQHSDPGEETDIIERCFSIERYQWALSTIWSRFVSLRLHDEGDGYRVPVLKAMAPVFDMLNHDPYAEVSHGYNAESDALEVVTHQHVPAGTQLCINYGAVSNHKLLTLYGFVIPANPFDSMDFWIPVDQITTSLSREKVAALRDLGIDYEVTAFDLSATEEDVDPAMLLAARVIQLECNDEAELRHCVDRIKFGDILSQDHEKRSLSLLISVLESSLDQLRPTEEVDYEREDDSDVDPRHAEMAAIVRESDQLILENTIDILKKMLLNVLPQAAN